jgi:putative DNA primase/helicase
MSTTWERARKLEGVFREFPNIGEAPGESAAKCEGEAYSEPANTEEAANDPTLPSGPRRALAYSLDELRQVVFTPRPGLLKCGDDAILTAGNVGQVYAPRGMGKTLLLESLALALASGGQVMKWHAPQPRRVAVIDGEMPGPLVRQRFLGLADSMGVKAGSNLRILAADWQTDYLPRLDTVEGARFVEPVIADAEVVILDGRSCLFDPESETDPGAWQPAQDWLLSLRRRGKAVLVAHHANRLGGARGHSRPEDMLDVIIKLSRPEDYHQDQGARVMVEFEKNRSFYGPAAAPFVAQLVDNLWHVEGEAPSRAARLRERIREWVAANPGATKTKVVNNVTGREQDIRSEMDLMGEAGELRKDNGRWYAA